MKKFFSYFTYVVLIIAGGWMLVITTDGHTVKICIACIPFSQLLLGTIAVLTGVAGIAGNIGIGVRAER